METKQLKHIETINATLNNEIIVITENIRTPENIGMIFRVSEAFGVKKIFLIGNSPDLKNKKVKRTARNTDNELDIKTIEDIGSLISELKSNNYFILGLELTNTSQKINAFDFSKHQKIAIIVGAERFGIDTTTLKNLDKTLHIEMFGKNSSINVVNALGICLYEMTR